MIWNELGVSGGIQEAHARMNGEKGRLRRLRDSFVPENGAIERQGARPC